MTHNKLRVVIVDDEPIAVSILQRYVEDHPKLELHTFFTNSKEALAFLEKNKTDLLLLDIQMPGITGIQLIKTLGNKPWCIFTTAYRDYALDGFELDVVDYLMKPIRYNRFEKAIEKTLERIKAQPTYELEANKEVLNFSMHRKNYRIPLRDIVYLESRRNTVHIFTKEEEYQCTSTLSSMMDKLPAHFVRIHRSFIVNKEFIYSFNQSEIILTNKQFQLPVGKNYSQNLT